MKSFKMAYPAVRRAATTYTLHGKTIPEPYDYLEEPDHTETKQFVTAQNELFEGYMESSADVREKICERVSAMQNYPRTGNPSSRGDKFYYFHNSGLQNQNILMRADTIDAPATVFLDPNTLSADGTTALKASGWSENQELFAYCLSDKGSDWEHIHIRNAKTGEDLPDNIQWAKFTGVSWWKNEGFFYTRYPSLGDDVDKGAETDSARDAYVCFHRVGTSQEEDVTVLKVPEQPLWSLHVEVSDDNEYLIATISDGCEPNNRIWIAKLPTSTEDLAKPLSFNKVVDEFVSDYSYLGNDGECFYFTSTKDAPLKKVVTINLADGAEVDFVPQQRSLLSYAALVKQTLLLVYLEDVKDVVYHCALADRALKKIDLPIGSIVSLYADRNKDFVSFKISSFLLPGRSYVMDINDPQGSLKIFKDDSLEGFDPEEYVTEQRFYNSTDGTRIPMFIVRKKDAEMHAGTPVLAYAYGGFNISITPSFSAARLMYLKNLGGVLAIPNIRGGGEYGQAWHDAGRRANKQNCFTDFIEAIKFLHANNIGSPATTAIQGGSNGGLLVAATANQAPEELGCVVCQVGVLDMYKFHKFTIGHAWSSDYGNPDKEEDFKIVEKYSPIHNVRAGATYPPILVVTGDHDDRVVPLHSLKYVATLQHANAEVGGPFLARIEVAAGHGAGKPISKIVREAADIYAFIAKSIGAVWHD